MVQWMRKGIADPQFVEHPGSYLSSCRGGRVTGCALGAAYVGMIGDAHQALIRFQKRCRDGNAILFFVTDLGITLEEAQDIDQRHTDNTSTKEIIAFFEEMREYIPLKFTQQPHP